MAKKRSGVVSYRRRNKSKSRVPKLPANPPLGDDFMNLIAPAFVAYAGTRFLARIVHSLASKRFPRAGKHIAALSSVAAFAGSWTLIHRFEKTSKYHDGAVIGSAIAAGQTILQTYIPKYGWMVGDLESAKPATPAPAQVNAPQSAGALPPPSGDEHGDDFDGGAVGNNYGVLSGGALSISDAELDELESMV